MTARIAALTLAVLMCPVPGMTQTAQVMQQDKTVDVTKFRTFSYQVGHPAFLKEVDQRIVAGIEAQLVARGLTKAASGPGDVIVTYHSVQRTDLDLAATDKQARATGGTAEPVLLKVGTLAVDLKEAGTGKLVWRARIDDVLSGDQAAQMGTVDKCIVALFQWYPGSQPPAKTK
jgi:hypothetical protein